jgi:hypothetical protein
MKCDHEKVYYYNIGRKAGGKRKQWVPTMNNGPKDDIFI